MIYCFYVFAILALRVTALWPIPSSYTNGDGVLFIDQGVQISYNNGTAQVVFPSLRRFSIFQTLNSLLLQYTGSGYSTQSLNSSSGANAIITTAINSTTETLFGQQFVPWKFHPRFSDFEPASNASKTYIRSISLQQNTSDPLNVTKPAAGSVDEAYSLSITEDGEVTIVGSSSIGIAHGLKTFTQLFYKHTDGSVYTPLAPVKIQDSPKFEHRGLNIDIARAWYEPKDILRMIDALAYNKFNRLHLHITDAQSWPLEVTSMPELAGKGAFGPEMSYSPATLASIQEYGAVRGVETILEIDMPGHTSSIWFSHPELIAAFNQQPNWDIYSAEPPSGTLKLNSSAVTVFLEKLFDDLLPRVSPYSSYFHTGGDEVNYQAYNLDETVRSNETSVLQPLMQAFVDRNHASVRAAGLIPVVWEEMLLAWNLTLGSDVVVQTWQSDEAVAQTVSKGHKALVGNYEYWVSLQSSSSGLWC